MSDVYQGYAREALKVLRRTGLEPPDQRVMRAQWAPCDQPLSPSVGQITPEETEVFLRTVSKCPNARQPVFPPDPGRLFDGAEHTSEVMDVLTGGNTRRESVMEANASLGAHDPHLFKDEETGLYYASASGAGGALRRSKDLIHWTYVGSALPRAVPLQAATWCRYSDRYQARSVWAPEVQRVGSQYRMYYSVSTSCHRRSYIGLAVSDTPEGPYTDMGELVKTDENAPVNAIDPNLIVDANTGEHFLNFGSYWNGIAQIQLDPVTGLRLENGQPYYGRLLWKRHHSVYREIEGAHMIYYPETGYYYLFVSYDSTVTDYNIRVARSRSPQGPFVDERGRPVSRTHTDAAPDDIGLKIVDCWQFGGHFGWCATGHNGILHDGDRWLISFHARPAVNLKCAVMRIHMMLFDKEGWPLVSPCQYTGETIQDIDPAALCGVYERILLDRPDGEHLCHRSRPMALRADGQAMADGRLGRWSLENGHELTLCFNGIREQGYVLACFDVDAGCPVLAITTRRSDGVCAWSKKRMEAKP